MKKINLKLFVCALFAMLATTPLYAAVDLTGVELDTTTPTTLATTVLIGLGVIWGIRKLVKLINRS